MKTLNLFALFTIGGATAALSHGAEVVHMHPHGTENGIALMLGAGLVIAGLAIAAFRR